MKTLLLVIVHLLLSPLYLLCGLLDLILPDTGRSKHSLAGVRAVGGAALHDLARLVKRTPGKS